VNGEFNEVVETFGDALFGVLLAIFSDFFAKKLITMQVFDEIGKANTFWNPWSSGSPNPDGNFSATHFRRKIAAGVFFRQKPYNNVRF
jgi:hypothetical protein